MAGKTQFYEAELLNAEFRRRQFAVAGGNGSTTNILVTSSTGAVKGQIVKGSAAGSYHEVTDVPDGTHVTVSPAFAAAPTTGTLDVMAYRPAERWIALFTALPSDTAGGTEVSTGNYVRKQVTQADGSWSAPSGNPRSISNSAAIEWLAATFTVAVVGWGIMDRATGGNLTDWFDSVDKTPNSGDDVRFPIGTLVVSED